MTFVSFVKFGKYSFHNYRARKTRPITLGDHVYRAEAISRTKGGAVELNVSPEYLRPDDRVVLVDDFLARGSTAGALAQIVVDSGATLCGIGCVVEKVFEEGRHYLEHLEVPIISLAAIVSLDGTTIDVRDPAEVFANA
ncbi:hypothetical protein KFU94_05420 [Chloroflexi bacterium TSY]|nr:hypothetical protein [Chloroflexi bacterium TSY]